MSPTHVYEPRDGVQTMSIMRDEAHVALLISPCFAPATPALRTGPSPVLPPQKLVEEREEELDEDDFFSDEEGEEFDDELDDELDDDGFDDDDDADDDLDDDDDDEEL